MKAITIRDVARKAGVSITTVSRVLNHRPDVHPETRERVEKVMAECHFVGNANARGLRAPDGETVAIIQRGHRNIFLNSLVESMLRYTKDAPANFLVEVIDEKEDEFRAALRLAHENRASAFIFAGGYIDERCSLLESLDLPFVFSTVGNGACLPGKGACVSVDDRAMGYAAARTLIDLGHRHFSIIGSSNFGQRYAGVLAALQEAGIDFPEERYAEVRFSLSGGRDEIRRVMQELPDTTAVICMSDIQALGVIRGLHELGLKVPEDVSVFGFDGIDIGKYSIPSLSTIEQPVDEIARETIQLMLDMLLREENPRQVIVDANIRLRESIGPVKNIQSV